MNDEFYAKYFFLINEMRSIGGENWELQFDNDP